MQRGGRPARLGPATVEVALDRRHLRTVVVDNPLQPYRFEVPLDLAAAIEEERRPGILRLVSRTWNPARALGTADTRDLGVIVDRATVE